MSELKEPEQELILFSVEEAAQFLKLSEETLQKLRSRGGGPRFLRIGRRILYARGDLAVWLQERRYSSTSEYQQ